MNKKRILTLTAIIFGSLYGEAFCSVYCPKKYAGEGSQATSFEECFQKCVAWQMDPKHTGLSEGEARTGCGAGEYGLGPLEDKKVADAE